MRIGFARRLKGWLSWLGFALFCLLLIALGEWLPLMPAVQRYQDTHLSLSQALIGVTVAMTVLGTLLLVFTQFLVRVPDPHQASQTQTLKTKGILKYKGGFFSGLSLSAGFSDQARMWRVRKAFREGEWWRKPRWRRMTLMMLGAILVFYGLFGLLFLLAFPGLKFFLLLVVLYGTTRSLYAFGADRPFSQE